MAAGERYFVEWKEQYVSKERGNRVVHYFLKDNLGESVLAIVGTERSVRHMFYIVADEFLNAHGADNCIHAGFRWRSRREVVNWLTSMLSKQHRRGDHSLLPNENLVSEAKAELMQIQPTKGQGRSAKNSKVHHLDIGWSGSAWSCGKQLKHYMAFRRNGISITVQSFVFVMAERENRYIAYLEDMYEDRKCQKKVKVRWFHYSREVKGVVSLQDSHPKEVFITPYIQVISAECVDGPAIVLTREHYEKCHSVFPHNLLNGVHFCFRQFKSNRIMPFKLSRLRSYFDQSIFSCFSADFFEDDEEEFSSEEDVKVGAYRSIEVHHKLTVGFPYKRCNRLDEKPYFFKHDGHLRLMPSFSVDDKVEFLCQDSGMRGCWFRCTVLEVSSRKIKIRYDDIKDEDSGTHLEEWIPACRVAKTDKLNMRCFGRPTLRPSCPCGETISNLDIGVPTDAWWSDGWWEGVISKKIDTENGVYQIYVPGESLYLNVEMKNIRISRDWVGDRWVDIKPNPGFMSSKEETTTNTKLSTLLSIVEMDSKLHVSPSSLRKIDPSPAINEEINELELTNVPLREECCNNEQQRSLRDEENEEHSPDNSNEPDDDDEDIDTDDEDNLVECEIEELKYEDDETMDMVTET